MKKRVAILLGLICAMVIGLCACGGNGGGNSGSGGGKSTSVDVGEFTVKAPSSWFVYEQTDMFGEKDAEGNYPKRTDAIGFIVGGKEALDAFSKPTVYVYYYDNVSAADEAETSKAWSFGEVTDKDPVTIDGKECIMFEEKQESLLDETKFYIYQYVFVPATESSCFQVTIPVDMAGEGGITVDDADVQAVIASLAAKE
ncbi:MAG: hypothetical protein J5483_02740 [Lachnospiraceae bacterium]|nr:hypothetical protein [Lachnospiraceae bacterium]